ncbi:inorganic diphosphatase [Tritonibacter sp. SIMBA_163]|uniref:inorganic diphosphatase n=1 Tax=Tritonibacter sp. SIMBA_163 TaxID=3080868 RepID=UPI00397F61F8
MPKQLKELKDYTDLIGRRLHVMIDRPMGTAHPRFPQTTYPLNYGFVPEIFAGDGYEVDAYIVGETTPVEACTGKCLAVVERLDDDENKLIVSTGPTELAADKLYGFVRFQEDYFDTRIHIS